MKFTAHGSKSIRCAVMRGGTSRGVFFHADDLPKDQESIDRIMMAVVGAPDPRQVDGLGGADLLLSKVAIVRPSKRAGTDIECRFGSIPPGSKTVKYGANCGNLSAAVALYAWQENLTSGDEPLRIFNPDSNSAMEARLKSENFPSSEMSGMPATGTLVELTFLDPAGTASDCLLPTGKAVDFLQLPEGRTIPASIIDSGALYVFVRAEDAGLPYAASSKDLQSHADTMNILEYLRGQAAVLVGLAKSPAEARLISGDIPKLAFVSPPSDYRTEGSDLPVSAKHIHLISRIISNQSFHKAYAVTGAIATASAAVVPGSVVYQLIDSERSPIQIGHPTGIMKCAVQWSIADDEVVISTASVLRTARRIAEGHCFLPDDLL